MGRKWQCGTLQLDFSMPARLGAGYIAEDNTKKIPVMLHRAILGSMERFIGILIEHHAGALPVWLSPDQVIVLNISRNQIDYVQSVVNELKRNGIRASSDLRNEKISYKIREHSLQKIPYLVVIGDKEVENQTVAVRGRLNHDHGTMSLDGFITLIRKEIAERT